MGNRFAGKVAVVTGGGKGIGRACALGFAAEGAAVVVADVDDAATRVTAQAATDAGGSAVAVHCDVRRAPDVAMMVDTAVQVFGGVDILVNNAGIFRYGTVVQMAEQDWDDMFAVNIKAMFLTCKHAIPEMERRRGGAIVNVASVSSFAATPLSTAYSATKGAVLSFTRALAVDHAATNIRCNCIAPGSIATPMLHASATNFSPDDPARAIADWGRSHPLGRVGTPEEAAKLILFLASDDAAFCTGACYLIDGGLLATLFAQGGGEASAS